MAREGERHRKREADLGENLAPGMEVRFPQKQFLLIARKKKTEYPASLLSRQKQPLWPLATAPTQLPACRLHYSWVENSPLGKMPNHQGKVQKGARASLMAWTCLKCLLHSCLALELVSSGSLGNSWQVSGPFPPPAAASWGNISCPHMVTLPTPRDSTGHGRQDIFQQQELPEQESTGHTRSQQPIQDRILLSVRCRQHH